MAQSDYLGTAVLNYVFHGTAMPVVSNISVGAFTSTTGLVTNSQVNEISSTAYARGDLSVISFASNPGGSLPNISNTIQASLPYNSSGTSWTAFSVIVILDSLTNGQILLWDSINSTTVGAGQQCVFPTGSLGASANLTDSSRYWSEAVFAYFFSGTALPTVNPYIALFTSSATSSAILANDLTHELSTLGYARLHLDGVTNVMSTPSGSSPVSVNNTTTLTFPQAGEEWDIAHAAIMDASTGGNVLYYIALGTGATLAIDTYYQFSSGSLVINES